MSPLPSTIPRDGCDCLRPRGEHRIVLPAERGPDEPGVPVPYELSASGFSNWVGPSSSPGRLPMHVLPSWMQPPSQGQKTNVALLNVHPHIPRTIVARFGWRCHRCVTHSRNQEDTEGHGRTRRRAKSRTGGHWRKRRDTAGHEVRRVRDREAPGSNPGPPTNVMCQDITEGPWPRRVFVQLNSR